MIGLRHQQHNFAEFGAIAQLPGHVETLGDRIEPGLERRKPHGEIGGIEHHSHEEAAGLGIVELLGIDDVLAVVSQERGLCGYDPGPVGAGSVSTN
jgi:hypothetical protein